MSPSRPPKRISLLKDWAVGPEIGSGGFGRVHVVASGDEEAVAKFVPKSPGAGRELLFVDLTDAVNVVPILDSGETKDSWVLVMPRATYSLRHYLASSESPLETAHGLDILKDIADSLVSLEARVVHRDLKPDNVLLLDGRWCLSDFGISRYAEASTQPDTHKFSMSPPYAAPERWRNERATSASDVYSLGVIGYEVLSGHRPFEGSSWEQWRDLHLHSEPARLTALPAPLASLLDECLYKAPEARPSPANLRERLERANQPPASSGLSALQEAHLEQVVSQQEATRRESVARTEAERRAELATAGEKSYVRISESLINAIEGAAPSASLRRYSKGGWMMTMGRAHILMNEITFHSHDDWGSWDPPAFDVITAGGVSIKVPPDPYEYEGRSHSLWFCDVREEGRFAWYETAFMLSPFSRERGRQDPFWLTPGEGAAKAVWSGMAEFQVAWPFTELVVGELDDFIDRWARWFAAAAQGKLSHPNSMPERPADGTWRRS